MNIDKSLLITAATKADQARVQTQAAIDRERDRRIDDGVEFDGHMYQTKATDRENIAGAAQMAFMAMMTGAEPGDLRWSDPNSDFQYIALDNTRVPMDAQTMVEFGKTAAGRKGTLIFAASNLKQMATIPADFTDDKYWP